MRLISVVEWFHNVTYMVEKDKKVKDSFFPERKRQIFRSPYGRSNG